MRWASCMSLRNFCSMGNSCRDPAILFFSLASYVMFPFSILCSTAKIILQEFQVWVFRKSHLEIFARACGARRGIIVEVGAGFQPAPTSTIIFKTARTRAALHQKATFEKPWFQVE